MEPIPSAREVVLCTHAVELFRERLRPTLGLPAARGELERLRESGRVLTEAPEWVRERAEHLGGYFLEAGPDLVLPLAPHFDRDDRWVALSCIVRDEPPSANRRRLDLHQQLRERQPLHAEQRPRRAAARRP